MLSFRESAMRLADNARNNVRFGFVQPAPVKELIS